MQNETTVLNGNEFAYLNTRIPRYCIKTGQELTAIPYIEVQKLIEIHGEERAQIVIQKLKQSIALEWILTDSEALQALSAKQPVEYLIYVLSAILTKPQPDNTLAIMDDFHDKIAANHFLHTLPFEQIANTAECTRRVLASNRPIAIQEMLHNINMKEICASADSLFKFQYTLQECLKQIALGYYDDQLVNDRKRQKKQLFEKQKCLTALTDLEKEIGISLNDFEIIIDNETELQSIIKKSKQSKERAKAKDLRLTKYQRAKDNNKASLNQFKGNSFGGVKFGSKK